MTFFFKSDWVVPLFQIFLIFQLLSKGVTNLFSCTKLLVVTCRKSVNYVTATDSHAWWGNGFFLGGGELKLRFLNILKFLHFLFFRFKCLFLSEFSTFEDGIGLKRLLMAHTTLAWQLLHFDQMALPMKCHICKYISILTLWICNQGPPKRKTWPATLTPFEVKGVRIVIISFRNIAKSRHTFQFEVGEIVPHITG